jgi:hypothetical protein
MTIESAFQLPIIHSPIAAAAKTKLIWVSRESESRQLEGEEPATHFTIERVRVLRAGLSPNQAAGLKLGKPESPGFV